MKRNYKSAIFLTIFTVIVSKFLFPLYWEKMAVVLYGMALLCLILPPFGNFLHDMASKTGKFLGNIISKIILVLVWTIAVLPTGILMKTVKRDRLRLKKPDSESYWIDNNVKEINYEYQF